MDRRSPLRTLSFTATTALVFAALVFATIVIPPLSSRVGPKLQDSVINETSFRLTLPGPWIAGDKTDPSRRTYHSAGGNEGLTVSIFGSFFGGPGSKSR